MKRVGLALAVFLALHVHATPKKLVLPHLAEKQQAAASIESRTSELTALSDEVWRYAETALQGNEVVEGARRLGGAKGFRVTRGVASMPTAFVAEFGSGQPVIGIMGEYDALPGHLAEGAADERSAGGRRAGPRLRPQPLRRRQPRRGDGDQGSDRRRAS